LQPDLLIGRGLPPLKFSSVQAIAESGVHNIEKRLVGKEIREWEKSGSEMKAAFLGAPLAVGVGS
jgi:hypothetical protein